MIFYLKFDALLCSKCCSRPCSVSRPITERAGHVAFRVHRVVSSLVGRRRRRGHWRKRGLPVAPPRRTIGHRRRATAQLAPPQGRTMQGRREAVSHGLLHHLVLPVRPTVRLQRRRRLPIRPERPLTHVLPHRRRLPGLSAPGAARIGQRYRATGAPVRDACGLRASANDGRAPAGIGEISRRVVNEFLPLLCNVAYGGAAGDAA